MRKSKVGYSKEQAEKAKAAEEGARKGGGWSEAIKNFKEFVNSDEEKPKKYQKLRKSMKR